MALYVLTKFTPPLSRISRWRNLLQLASQFDKVFENELGKELEGLQRREMGYTKS